MTTISLVATDQLLSIAVKPKVASGDQNSVELHVDFDSKWDSYGKSAVFYTSDNDKIYEIPLIFGNCVIPHEVLAKPGTLYIGIRGVNADNNAVKTSSLVKYKISEGAPRGEGTTVEPTADVYQQIMTAYAKTESRLHELLSMRGGDGVKSYEFKKDIGGGIGTVNCNIQSNGVVANIELTLTAERTLSGIFSYHIGLEGFPELLALCQTELKVTFPSSVGDLSVKVVNFRNSTSSYPGITFEKWDGVSLGSPVISASGVYPLASPYVDELGDIRVDYKGNAHATAGEAVRAQCEEVSRKIEEIGVSGGGGGGSQDSVLYTEQTLTPEQQAQARENIGAATVDEVIAALPIYNGEVV